MPATVTPKRTIELSSYYDAAATTTEQDYGAFTAICSEDFYFTSSTRAIALGRLRRECRNNPYLAGLHNKYPEGIGQSNLRTRTKSRDYNDAKDTWWFKRRRKVTACGLSRRAVEKLILREMLVAGEIFFVKLRNGRLQIIASEFCGSTAAHVATADGREINGILYNAASEPVAYRFGRMSPVGVITYEGTTPVPAAQVIHIYDRDRVQQGRGMPWFLPSLKTARDLYEITRTKTKQIKDANIISGWIEKAGAAELLKGLGAITETDPATGTPAPEKPDDAADPVTTGPVVVKLKPGTFIALEPGEKLTQLTSQYNATDYKELILLMLHAIATPVGMPVELWFSGLGDVNYSGYKGLGVQWDGRRRDVIAFLIDHFFEPYHAWLVDWAENVRDLPAAPTPDSVELVDWMFRRTPILDDEKNARANKIRLETGETDLAAIWEENGEYAEEVFARRRQIWIKALIAAGELDENGDHSKVKVPVDFLLRNELPGETTVPHIPDGSGITSATAAAESATAADESAERAEQAAASAARTAETVRDLAAQLSRK